MLSNEILYFGLTFSSLFSVNVSAASLMEINTSDEFTMGGVFCRNVMKSFFVVVCCAAIKTSMRLIIYINL